ncbi:MAG: HAD-IB family hydrolase [Clostridia bacterium]|nr:HAD-IB family hydrolase [Clostridia bacterium]
MRAALYDFDGTLRAGDSIVTWLLYARQHRAISFSAFLAAVLRTGAAMAFGSHDMAKIKSRALAFEKNLTRSELRALAEGFVKERLIPEIFPEGMAAWQRDGQEGYLRVLVSASTSDYMPCLAKALGADALICTQIDREGRILENCRGEVKMRRLIAWRDALPPAQQPDFSQSKAYGNSDGDLDMLALCGEAHLIGNNQKALRLCRERGIQCIHGFTA